MSAWEVLRGSDVVDIVLPQGLFHQSTASLLLLFSCSIVSNSLQPNGLQHARFPVFHYLLEFAQTQVH